MAGHVKEDSARERRVMELVARFGENYSEYQYIFVNFLVEHLGELSRLYRGDMQQVLLLAIIGQRWLSAMNRNGNPSQVMAVESSITSSRLSDVTGIARETVRRKLFQLKENGWLKQDENGAWFLVVDDDGMSLPVRRDHANFDQHARQRIARLVASLESI